MVLAKEQITANPSLWALIKLGPALPYAKEKLGTSELANSSKPRLPWNHPPADWL